MVHPVLVWYRLALLYPWFSWVAGAEGSIIFTLEAPSPPYSVKVLALD